MKTKTGKSGRERIMFLEAQHFGKSGVEYYRREFPFMMEWRNPSKQSIYPIQRNGFCVYGEEVDLDADEKELFIKDFGKSGQDIAERIEDEMRMCCEYCGHTWTQAYLTLGDLTNLLSRWDSGMPRWFYEKMLRHNYTFFN